jgi:AcrR family transcriptional regulator
MPEPAPDRNGLRGDRVSRARGRADAVNNRARIIAAARTAIADEGCISMRELARRAGVSQGTLYRHFRTRVDVVVEIYRDQVHELTAAAPVLLAEHEPLVALSRWLNRMTSYARINRDFVDAVDTSALAMLLDAARARGDVRADVDARDVALLLGYLVRLDAREWGVRAPRLLQVIVDGLRR